MAGFFKRHSKNTGKGASASSPKVHTKKGSKESTSSASFNVLASSMKSPVMKQSQESTPRMNGESTNLNGNSHQLSSNSESSPRTSAQQSSPESMSTPVSDTISRSLGSEKSRQRSPSHPISGEEIPFARTSTPIHQQIQNFVGAPNTNTVNAKPSVDKNLKERSESRTLSPSQLKRELGHTPWRKKRLYNSPFPRFSHATSSTTSDTGAIYLMGGLGGKNVFGDMWIIEPVKHESQLSLPSPKHTNDNYPYIASPIENFDRMPAPRIGHACVLIGNAFIIFAGDTVTNSTQVLDNKLYFFNITSLKWTVTKPVGSSPSGRYGHQIAVLNFEVPHQSGRWLSYLYVFGGQLEDEYYSDIWKFNLTNFRDPKTSWVKIDPSNSKAGIIPSPLANHTMTAFEDKLYVYGGFDGKFVHDDLLRFDPITEDWTKCDLHGKGRPPALQDHAAALYQNLLFIYGGKLEDDSLSSDLYVIDLKTYNCWKIKSDLAFNPGPRCGYSLTADIVNEKLVIMGGDGSDKDFTGVYEDARRALDESQFSFPSSVIYEFDLRHISKYMEKDSASGSIHGESHSPQKDISESSANVSNSTSITSGEQFTDASDIQPVVEASNKGFPTKINLEETSNNDTVVITSSSKPTGNSANISSDIPVQNNHFPKTYDTNRTPINSEFPSDVKTPERAPDRPVMDLSKGVAAPRGNNVSDEEKETDLLDPPPKRSELTPTILPATNSKVELVGNDDDDGDMSDESDSSVVRTGASTAASNIPYEQVPASKYTGSVNRHASKEIDSQYIGSIPAESQKLQQMASMIRNLKKEMQERVNDANNQIVKLEDEKHEAYMKLENAKQKSRDMSSRDDELDRKTTQIQELQKRLEQLQKSGSLDVSVQSESPTDNQKDSQSDNSSPQDLTICDKVGYENKILKLENDNSEIRRNFESTVSYIKSELMKFKGLDGVVEAQQKKILNLQEQLVEEAELRRKITELEGKCRAAEDEVEKLRSVYGVSEGDKRLDHGQNEIEKAEPTDSLSSEKQFDVQPLLERLDAVSLREDRTIDGKDESQLSQNKTIQELQSQVDKLLNVNKDAENQLRSKVEVQDRRLKELEEAYKNSVNSLNNTHRALTLSQSEMEKLKDANKKLSSDLDELKLKRSISPKVRSDEDAENGESKGVNSRNDEDFSEIEAQYSFKIKDLEAELFIASQERDKMREELVSLKKKIFTSPDVSASPQM